MVLRRSGPRLNIKTVLSTYGDFHVKDKTAVRWVRPVDEIGLCSSRSDSDDMARRLCANFKCKICDVTRFPMISWVQNAFLWNMSVKTSNNISRPTYLYTIYLKYGLLCAVCDTLLQATAIAWVSQSTACGIEMCREWCWNIVDCVFKESACYELWSITFSLKCI